MRVAVIGGGASGLVALKYLKTAHEFFPGEKPISAKLFEGAAEIGGAYRSRTYEDAELGSSRQFITFSDYRYTPDSFDFLSAEDYCQYLEGYVRHFGLADLIHLSTTVTKVDRTIRGGHIIHYTKDGHSSKWACDAVAICSGLFSVPNIPNILGIENVPIILHSWEVREKAQFGVGKDVVIVGSGDSALEMAHLAATADTKSVTVTHRGGFLIAPKTIPEFPIYQPPTRFIPKVLQNVTLHGSVPFDVGHARFFCNSNLHHMVRECGLFDRYFSSAIKLAAALTYRHDVTSMGESKSRICYNRSSSALLHSQGTIRFVPAPSHILEEGILKCENHPDVHADMIVLATGYKSTFPFLDPSYPLPQHAKVRCVWKKDEPTVGFIGFVRPDLGAIPPISELQAQLWITNLLNQLPAPLEQDLDHYTPSKQTSTLTHHVVDHDDYVYQLAFDMNSIPSFQELLSLGGWKLVVCWLLSSSINTKFRLTGPWKWSGAQKVMDTEIWETITRRTLFGHLVFSVVPTIIFGTLSAIAHILQLIMDEANAWCENEQGG